MSGRCTRFARTIRAATPPAGFRDAVDLHRLVDAIKQASDTRRAVDFEQRAWVQAVPARSSPRKRGRGLLEAGVGELQSFTLTPSACKRSLRDRLVRNLVARSPYPARAARIAATPGPGSSASRSA